ncbi:MAG TPA: hypothetical protein VF846_10000 [Thermoanaerobaculia bacterium]|jgi:hypothetical protein
MRFTSEELDAFPPVNDFLVRLFDSGEGGLHLEFASASRGRLTEFPAWDHVDRDLRHFIPSDVPLGSNGEPYDDRDEGWRILIFLEGEWVYVAVGDAPAAVVFTSLFRVPRERYLQAWAALVDQFNPITPMEEPS